VRDRVARLDEVIDVRRTRGLAESTAVIQTDTGKRAMDAIRADLGAMKEEEDRLLAMRRDQASRKAAWSIGLLAAASVAFGLLVFFAVATRRQAAAEAARLAAEREHLAERARVAEFQERFVGILGHDLRNPLSALMMSLTHLERSAPEPQRKGIARMQASATRMERMVDQLLDLTRSRLAGGIPICPTSADLGVVVDRVVDELRAQCGSRRIEVERGADLEGTWDPDRLEQVASNLVGNAVGHGDPGEPVSVKIRGDGEHVVMTVHNAGSPIPDELRAVLFDPFRRGARVPRSEHTAGLGLGLYISREIVAAHGGTIDVTSDERHGTTFTVTLPRTPPATP
jgi:signal transduction histidine kinase